MPVQAPIGSPIRPKSLLVDFDRGAGIYGPSVGSVEVEEHIDEEKEQKCNTIEDEDVGDVGDVGFGEEKHLFFCGAHEKEAGGIEELQNISGNGP